MKTANKIEQRHMSKVASTGCVICREWHDVRTPGEIHHIAKGSGKRSHYMVACLCPEHHRGVSYGLHSRGVKTFCRQYKLHDEYWLLELQNKYIAKDGLLND